MLSIHDIFKEITRQPHIDTPQERPRDPEGEERLAQTFLKLYRDIWLPSKTRKQFLTAMQKHAHGFRGVHNIVVSGLGSLHTALPEVWDAPVEGQVDKKAIDTDVSPQQAVLLVDIAQLVRDAHKYTTTGGVKVYCHDPVFEHVDLTFLEHSGIHATFREKDDPSQHVNDGTMWIFFGLEPPENHKRIIEKKQPAKLLLAGEGEIWLGSHDDMYYEEEVDFSNVMKGASEPWYYACAGHKIFAREDLHYKHSFTEEFVKHLPRLTEAGHSQAESSKSALG